jgi:predicted membrane protein
MIQNNEDMNNSAFMNKGYRYRRRWEHCHRHHTERHLWLGIIIILVGIILLSKNLNFLSYEIQRYVLNWEMLLIVIGLVSIIFKGRRTSGMILLLVGGIFYLKNILNVIDFSFWTVFWPVILIAAGIMIIFRHHIDHHHEKKTEVSDDNTIDEIAVFGGGDRLINSQEFQGGKITTIFGGLNFNMLKAKMAPGENVIDVFCMFGGMKLIVPEGWTVKIKVMSFFGGFSDKHRYRLPESNKDESAQLVIKGTVFFGGGEIKSYLDN